MSAAGVEPSPPGVSRSEPVGAVPDLARFSFNQITASRWPIPHLVRGCAAAGVPGIGLWRGHVGEYGLERTVAAVAAAGLAVTSLCRGGFFTEPDWWDENRRALDEAAALGAPELIIVSGGLPAGSRDLAGARERVADAVARLVPHARDAGVRLAVEPLHPMFCADRCVINTVAQALEIAARHAPEEVGVVVDTYHLWWDDRAFADVARATGRIASFQVADWVTPLPAGVLAGRALPGAGCVDLRRWRRAVDAAGYHGPIEVEVISDVVSARPGDEILDAAIEGYRRAVL